jgi:hypothetical protein
LEAIRCEIERLAQRVQVLERQGLQSDEERAGPDDIPADLRRLVDEEREKKGRSIGIAAVRGVITRGPGGTGISVGRVAITDPSELPSEEQLSERAALGLDLLVLRTLRCFAERFLNGESVRVTQAELAASLGVEAAKLQRALTPLVAREWLRWYKTTSGEEGYEWLNNDGALVLLLFGQ